MLVRNEADHVAPRPDFQSAHRLEKPLYLLEPFFRQLKRASAAAISSREKQGSSALFGNVVRRIT
jgi:hypothetical protein